MDRIKEWLGTLTREKLEDYRVKLMIAFFIGLAFWGGGAILLLLFEGSWLLSLLSGLGKIVFWVCLIGYLVSGVACLFVSSKGFGKNKRVDDGSDVRISVRRND